MSLRSALEAHSRGDLVLAERLYRRYLQTNAPVDPLAYIWLATILAQKKNFSEALRLISRAEAHLSEDPNLILLKANVLADNGSYVDACNLYRLVRLNIREDSNFLSNKAACEVHCGNFQEALDDTEIGLRLNPTSWQLWNTKGLALAGLKRDEEAIVAYRVAITRATGQGAGIEKNLANALMRTEQYEIASDVYKSIKPETPENISLWGECLRRLGRSREVVSHLEDLSKSNKSSQLENVLAAAYKDVGRFDLAETHYQLSLEIDPQNTQAAQGLSIINLIKGDFSEGWSLYARRHLSRRGAEQSPPVWTGVPTAARVLIQAEQGLGDEILFSSMFCDVAQDAPNLTATCDPRLLALFAASFPEIEFRSREESLRISDFDFCLPAADLGQYYRKSLQSLRGDRRTLSLPERFDSTSSPLKNDGSVIGLSWFSEGAPYSKLKSIDPKALKKLVACDDYSFINLQSSRNLNEEIQLQGKDEGKSNEVKQLDFDTKNDLIKLASVLKRCDLVISCSNSIAHLSSALGVKTIVLTPGHAGKLWYWYHCDESGQSLWYPKTWVLDADNGDFQQLILSVVKDITNGKFA
jgi:Flp pilus assembly protein TadD